jgi:TPR repeat protein
MSLRRGLLILCLCGELSGGEKTQEQVVATAKPDAGADSYRQAIDLAAKNDKVRATKPYLDLMMKAAQAGYAKAQTNIGYAYASGEGMTRDPKEAVRWFRLAAAQGDPVAMDDLGYAHLNGDGVTRSTREAIRWYTQAAERGYGPAQVSLSDIYARDPKEANVPLAIAWRRIAMLSEEQMKEAPALLALEKTADQSQLAEAKAAYAAILKRMRQTRHDPGMTK